MHAESRRPETTNHPEFDQHEALHFFEDSATGMKAVIAIHSTALGPAFGGCRRWHYESEHEALTDALRLSRGMTYKNAIAGLPFGGGKAVILAEALTPKSPALFAAFGSAVESLKGRYITAGDVGVCADDMRHVRRETRYVSGITGRASHAGGDPSPWTALGVFCGIKASAAALYGSDSLEHARIAVQGVGNVGLHLCRLLHDAGAELLVADVNEEHLRRARAALPVIEVAPTEILSADVDIIAPCALGGVLNGMSIPRIRARIVAGAANNQLATEADGLHLMERDILYAPDFVINAGGMISVAREYLRQSSIAEVRAEVEHIADRLDAIFAEARARDCPTNLVADEMAHRIVKDAGIRKTPRVPLA